MRAEYCMYIAGDTGPGARYCGKPLAPDSQSYCAEHHSLCSLGKNPKPSAFYRSKHTQLNMAITQRAFSRRNR